MASFVKNSKNTSISVTNVELNSQGVAIYNIAVRVSDVTWSVQHRYSDFADLHKKLVEDHSIAKDALPPKKVIGNKDPQFLEKRRFGLENYLKMLISFLQRTMPQELVVFLDFHKYDTLFLLNELASDMFLHGDLYLSSSKSFALNSLQLHSISERLKQPCSSLEILGKTQDFSHVLDFCSQLKTLHVQNSEDFVGRSNIKYNSLPFDLTIFKSLEKLCLTNVTVSNIFSVGSLRASLKSLSVNNCRVETMSEFLLCDEMHKNLETVNSAHVWKELIEIDFSRNNISSIGNAVLLIPNAERLILADNKIFDLGNLTVLSHLRVLILSGNCLSNKSIENLHQKIGKIVSLNMAQNSLHTLEDFSKLYALESLDVGSNSIKDIAKVEHICSLPCLDYLVLTGNPVATIVDYRIKIFELFGNRAQDLCLDNEKPTQKELDTAAVLKALRIAKEEKKSLPFLGRRSPLSRAPKSLRCHPQELSRFFAMKKGKFLPTDLKGGHDSISSFN